MIVGARAVLYARAANQIHAARQMTDADLSDVEPAGLRRRWQQARCRAAVTHLADALDCMRLAATK